MSSLRPSSAVSQMTGAAAASTTATSSCGSIWPVPKLAWRSAPDPAASRESLQCTRSMRPVIALIRSTAATSASPAAQAWQVSRQNPMPLSPMWSHSRAIVSKCLAIAWSPPAVFRGSDPGRLDAAGVARGLLGRVELALDQSQALVPEAGVREVDADELAELFG